MGQLGHHAFDFNIAWYEHVLTLYSRVKTTVQHNYEGFFRNTAFIIWSRAT